MIIILQRQSKLIEDITRWRKNMNFMLEWREQYLMREGSKWMRYFSFYENIKFISSSWHVLFFLLYKHTDDGVFDAFPKISDHFPKKSFKNCYKDQMKAPKHFSWISKDCRRLSRKTPRCFDDTPMNLSTM